MRDSVYFSFYRSRPALVVNYSKKRRAGNVDAVNHGACFKRQPEEQLRAFLCPIKKRFSEYAYHTTFRLRSKP